MRALVAVLAAMVIPLSGCISDGGKDETGTLSAPEALSPEATVLEALDAIPAAEAEPSGWVQDWEDFVLAYPKRDWHGPHNLMATQFLAEALTSAGFETEIMEMSTPLADRALPLNVRIVRGVLEGKDPTHRFALVAHYDIVPQTIEGAYDDAAGTIAQLEICRLLAEQKAILNHSIECLFFDAEERGLWGSRVFMDWYLAEDRGYVYDLAIGYDMTGINWPGHEWNLYAMVGTQHEDLEDLNAPFVDFLGIVLHDFLDDPARLAGATHGVVVLETHDRNSDEMNFKREGIPVVRFAGGRAAADYPMYHMPGDLVEYVYEFVGGRANFEAGFSAVILSSYYTILGFDAFDPWNLPTDGNATLSAARSN